MSAWGGLSWARCSTEPPGVKESRGGVLSLPQHLRDLVTPTPGTELCWWLGTPKKTQTPSPRCQHPQGPALPPLKPSGSALGPAGQRLQGGAPPHHARPAGLLIPL